MLDNQRITFYTYITIKNINISHIIIEHPMKYVRNQIPNIPMRYLNYIVELSKNITILEQFNIIVAEYMLNRLLLILNTLNYIINAINIWTRLLGFFSVTNYYIYIQILDSKYKPIIQYLIGMYLKIKWSNKYVSPIFFDCYATNNYTVNPV